MTSQGLTVLGLEMAPEGFIAGTGYILPGLTYIHCWSSTTGRPGLSVPPLV
jgi:hypothetical protein